MKLPFTLPFLKKEEKQETPEENALLGDLTHCRLDDAQALCAPWGRDAFGVLRPPLTDAALRMSLELSETAYNFHLAPWANAGWQDFSILVDEQLHTGIASGKEAEGLAAVQEHLRLQQAKVDKDRQSIVQAVSVLRQKEKSDTVKALCMAHALSDGQVLIAIGVMGTGKRPQDWVPNLRFQPQDGFHQGFLQLADSLEGKAERILFPETAKALGLESLSLADVLGDLSRPKTPFRLWLTGHSQGGAVIQVLGRHLFTRGNIPPCRVMGYGFASPRAVISSAPNDPMVHVLNEDDFVPRVGSKAQTGLCLTGASELPKEETLLDAVAQNVTDTPSAFVMLLAFMECILREKGVQSLAELMRSRWSPAPLDRLLDRAGEKATELCSQAMENIRESHRALTGEEIPDERVKAKDELITPIVQSISLLQLSTAFAALTVPPHMLGEKGEDGAYAGIVKKGVHTLKPAIWQGEEPQLQTADAFFFRPVVVPKAVRTHRRYARRNKRGQWSRSYSANRR